MNYHRIVPLSILFHGLQLFLGSADLQSVSEASCHDTSAESSIFPQAALLQRKAQREEGHAALEQEPDAASADSSTTAPEAASDADCTGILSQGRCWHLSDVGETCDSKCAKYGEVVEYAAADRNKPLIPQLLGKQPKTQQQPWAFLECYVPGEDRFSTANTDAAKYYIGRVGAWSHPKCQLACPCTATRGECKLKQPPACAREFEYKGIIYQGCTNIDHDRPWCMHHHHHTDKDENSHVDWSPCIYDCGPDRGIYVSEEGCEWKPAEGCQPEFDYEGTHYVGCTEIDHDTPWCSLSTPYAGAWAHCSYSCPGNRNDIASAISAEVMSDNSLCTWQHPPQCAQPFEYKGVAYTGCTDLDHPTPWCSHDSNHSGSWSVCKRFCNEVAPPASPTFAPTSAPTSAQTSAPIVTPSPGAQAPAGLNPCERAPDRTFEGIGLNATLDEAGYDIVLDADSPLNTKRFVCRVVEKINCKVVLENSLMAFLPYMTASRTSYSHLQQELAVLCATPGKWIVPASPSPAPAPTTAAPTPVPTPAQTLPPTSTPAAEDPCTRQSDSSFEGIGMKATLDEIGYQTVTKLDSPLNTKRFICRVVEKISCKVVSEKSLMAFLPYSTESHDTYDNLETELAMICHSSGRWIVPV